VNAGPQLDFEALEGAFWQCDTPLGNRGLYVRSSSQTSAPGNPT
jgi:hypothetical protein